MQPVLNLDDAPPGRLDMARALLTPKPRPEPAWPAVCAAGLFMVSGLLLAYAAITAQPAEYAPSAGFKPVPQVAP